MEPHTMELPPAEPAPEQPGQEDHALLLLRGGGRRRLQPQH